jgi:Ca2+-transporting ATPase
MAGNLLDPKALLPPCQQAPSEAETAVSASPSFTTDKMTATSSFVEKSALEKPLDPNPRTETSVTAHGNPFNYTPDQLNNLLNPKSLDTLRALGGLEGLARGLHVDLNAGLSVDEVAAGEGSFAKGPSDSRSGVFGRNVLPPKKPKSIWRLAWITLQEAVLIMLLVAGTISLALGIYETVGIHHEPGEPTPVDWVEGVAILAAVIIVVVVASHNDWQKEKAFVKLNTRKDNREVKVLRSGRSMLINVHNVVVGDVLYLEPGDLVPVDGVFISGHNVKCDESSATGESDALRKTAGAVVFDTEWKGTKERDPFIISGSRVTEGESPKDAEASNANPFRNGNLPMYLGRCEQQLR